MRIAEELERRCATINKAVKISVLGCVVNGIGEARQADIGIFGFTNGIAKVFKDGEEYNTVSEDCILDTVMELL
jgi:(E)-4-hydroxy-3-methylbut-2-enyl-diphosphate synthase